MKEEFLHFVWRHQYFKNNNLKTTKGQPVFVHKPGAMNVLSGPDFSEGTITIGEIKWNGHVEIHIRSSQWVTHGHHKDSAYNNVVMHVVWEEDRPVFRKDGTEMPTIELKGRVNEKLIEKYETLMRNPEDIICANQLTKVDTLVRLAMIDKALVYRLEEKAAALLGILDDCHGDWNEATTRWLFRGFGFKSNGSAFYDLACKIPYSIIMKVAQDIESIEALLFGQAGFLTGSKASNPRKTRLRDKFEFLRRKFDLASSLPIQWKSGAVRPQNSATRRMRQLAGVLHNRSSIFQAIINHRDPTELRALFELKAGRSSKSSEESASLNSGESEEHAAPLGSESIDNLLLNVVVTILVAYGRSIGDNAFIQKAIVILNGLPPERNRILRRWSQVGITASTGADSQGLIQLYNGYCAAKKCLSCNIGTDILKRTV